MRGCTTRGCGHARPHDRSPRALRDPPRRESPWISAIAPASATGSWDSVFPEARGTLFFGDWRSVCLNRLVLDGNPTHRSAPDHDQMVRLVAAL
jgi:hypothetical protein